jgi:hypothetical protein
MDKPKDFKIEYAESFDVRDSHSDLELYRKALTTVSDPEFQKQISKKVADLLIEDETDLMLVEDSIDNPPVDEMTTEQSHPTTTSENRADHIREMLGGGYSDVEILNIHPEISQEDINRARNSA